MNEAALRFDHYQWSGGQEAMLRFGPDDGPIAIMALPLFEEANRTRAFAVAILRSLAMRGIAGVLPDMPGQGESLVPLESVALETMLAAHRSLADQLRQESRPIYALSIRSGVLLDATSKVDGCWSLAPQDGPALLRELTRLRQAALGTKPALREDWFADLIDNGQNVPVEIAGNIVSPALLGDLLSRRRGSRPVPTRIIRLTTDPAPSDAKIEGSSLWRRSEPDNDLSFAQRLADDISEWISACES